MEYWDAIGRASSPGTGDDPGKFGNDGRGGTLYHLPGWGSAPQYWEYIEAGSRVLDIGSGTGLQVGRLVPCGIFAVGCDISRALLEVARSNLVAHGIAQPMLVQWDGCRMPFASGAFDRVTTNTVLQHVVDEDALGSVFSEASRVVGERGLLLICELVSPRDVQTAPHVKMRSAESYGRVAAASGFQTREVRHVPSIYVTLQEVYCGVAGSVRAQRNRLAEIEGPMGVRGANLGVGAALKRGARALVAGLAAFT
ncbi:MAG: class I SAM-dependent methyltransferase [Chloroflexi bacterium]|nr:class I SAM-dependent methyltransferase [Chloroflexota bacterium]